MTAINVPRDMLLRRFNAASVAEVAHAGEPDVAQYADGSYTFTWHPDLPPVARLAVWRHLTTRDDVEVAASDYVTAFVAHAVAEPETDPACVDCAALTARVAWLEDRFAELAAYVIGVRAEPTEET